MLYVAECRAMRKKGEYPLNKTEMRILRWIQGISLKYHIMSEDIRKRVKIKPVVDCVTKRRFHVVLAVILINDTYVANLYHWSSLIRIFYAKMYN